VARAYERGNSRASDVPPASGARAEETHLLQRPSPEQDRRYRELADKLDVGLLTAEEQQELEALIAETERLMLENSRTLLRRRDPKAFAVALTEERRVRRWTGSRQRVQRP
jgi:hypothetical protein